MPSDRDVGDATARLLTKAIDFLEAVGYDLGIVGPVCVKKAGGRYRHRIVIEFDGYLEPTRKDNHAGINIGDKGGTTGV